MGHLLAVHGKTDANRCAERQGHAFVQGFIGDGCDADQFCAQRSRAWLDFLSHGRRIFNTSLPWIYPAILVAQLPCVTDRMSHHGPGGGHAEEIVQRLPIQRRIAGVVKYMPGLAQLLFIQPIDLIAGTRLAVVAEVIFRRRRILRFDAALRPGWLQASNSSSRRSGTAGSSST